MYIIFISNYINKIINTKIDLFWKAKLGVFTKHPGVCMFLEIKKAKKVKKFCKKVLTFPVHPSILSMRSLEEGMQRTITTK